MSFVKKHFSLISILFSILFLILIAYLNRVTLLTSFDFSYTRDFFDHSQWRVDGATRVIPDNLVYQVSGLDLVKNQRFFDINPEVPPFGKYLIGLSILLFGNPQIIPFFLFIISAILFYLLSKQLVSKNLAIIASLIFLTEPLLFSQGFLSMLDLPLLVTLQLHVISVVLILKLKRSKTELILLSIIAGCSLGFFIGTKIGVFAAAPIISDAYFLFKSKKTRYFFLLLILSGVFYAALYAPFLLQGNSIHLFLGAQKWMLNFYFISKVKAIYGMEIFSMITGYWKLFIKGFQIEKVWEWTILWPVYFLSLIFISYQVLRRKLHLSQSLQYVLLCSILIFGLNLVIPFWIRYLVILVPFLIIIFVYFLPKIDKRILSFLFIVYAIQVGIYLYNPLTQNQISDLTSTWSNGSYQELYQSVDKNTQNSISRSDFLRKYQIFDRNLGTISRDVKITDYSKPWESIQRGSISVNYRTDLGVINNTQPITFEKENNVWKIVWNDNLVFKDLNNITETKTYEPEVFGNLRTEKGTVLTHVDNQPYFFVTPYKIRDEQLMQKQLKMLTGIRASRQEFLYKANNQPDWPSPIGFLKPELNFQNINGVNLDPGISFEMRPAILYSPVFVKNEKQIKQLVKAQKIDLTKLNPVVGGELKVFDGEKLVKDLKKREIDGKNLTIKDLNL